MDRLFFFFNSLSSLLLPSAIHFSSVSRLSVPTPSRNSKGLFSSSLLSQIFSSFVSASHHLPPSTTEIPSSCLFHSPFLAQTLAPLSHPNISLNHKSKSCLPLPANISAAYLFLFSHTVKLTSFSHQEPRLVRQLSTMSGVSLFPACHFPVHLATITALSCKTVGCHEQSTR